MARDEEEESDRDDADRQEPEKSLPVELTQIVKETDFAFKLPDKTLVDKNQYLVWLGNQIWEIKKAVA